MMDLCKNNLDIQTGIGNETLESITPSVPNKKPICPDNPSESCAVSEFANTDLSNPNESEDEVPDLNAKRVSTNYTSVTNGVTGCTTENTPESYAISDVTNSGRDSPNLADDEDSNHGGQFINSNGNSNPKDESSSIAKSDTNSEVSESNEGVLNSPSEADQSSESVNLNDTPVVNEESNSATETAASEVTTTEVPEINPDVSSTLNEEQDESSALDNGNDTNTEVNTHEEIQTNSSEPGEDSTNSNLTSVPTEGTTSATENVPTIDLSEDDVQNEVTDMSTRTDDRGENCRSSPTISLSDIGSSPSVYLSPESDNEDQDQTGPISESSSPSKSPKWKPIISGSEDLDGADGKLSQTAGFGSHMVLIPEDTIKQEEFVDESDELTSHEKGPKKPFFPEYPDLQIQDEFVFNPCSIKLEKISWPDFSVRTTTIPSEKKSPVNRKRKSTLSPSSPLKKKMKASPARGKATFGRRLIVQQRPQSESPKKVIQSRKRSVGASAVSSPSRARQRKHISPINRAKPKRDNPPTQKVMAENSPIEKAKPKKDSPSTDMSPLDRKSRRLSGRLPENDVAILVRGTPVAAKEIVATKTKPGPKSSKLVTQPTADSKRRSSRPGPASSKPLLDMVQESRVVIKLPKCDFIDVEELTNEKTVSRKRKKVSFADDLEQWSPDVSSIVETADELPEKDGDKSKRSRKGKPRPKSVDKAEKAKQDMMRSSFLEAETEEEKGIIDYKRGIANYLAEVERYRKTIRIVYECLCCDQKYHLLEQAKEHVRGHFPGTLTS